MPTRTEEQEELLALLQNIEINEVYIYAGDKSYNNIRMLVYQWRMRGKFPGADFRSFQWNGLIYFVKVREKRNGVPREQQTITP